MSQGVGMVASSRKSIAAGSAEAYAFATLCVAVAALVRWAIGLFVADVVPFATFFPAVLFAALVGGIGPGSFAAIVVGIPWSTNDLLPVGAGATSQRDSLPSDQFGHRVVSRPLSKANQAP